MSSNTRYERKEWHLNSEFVNCNCIQLDNSVFWKETLVAWSWIKKSGLHTDCLNSRNNRTLLHKLHITYTSYAIHSPLPTCNSREKYKHSFRHIDLAIYLDCLDSVLDNMANSPRSQYLYAIQKCLSSPWQLRNWN